jgi:cysteine desulfurase / selenocysteine lyase
MFKDSIYLDYASTHPRKKEISDARALFEHSSYANIGRGNYDLAEAAMIAYQESKKAVARWIDCEPLEVLYTYSATYAINILALACEQNKVLQKWDTILLSLSEHHANIVPWQMLAQRIGAQVKFVGLDEYYCLDLKDLENKLDDSVKVVSLQYASNVTGATHPLEKIREIIWDRLFFVDASQMVLHWPISMKNLWCDALVFSGHKMMADTGIGILALRRELQKLWYAPFGGGGAIHFVSQDGYEQAGIPDRWEPGTPHITGAVTLGAAIAYLERNSSSQREKYVDLLRHVDTSFGELRQKWIQIFHSHTQKSLGIWSFVITWKHSTDVADIFSDEGICLRSWHHCCGPLHTYLWISWTVRMSIGFDTTLAEIERFFGVLNHLL